MRGSRRYPTPRGKGSCRGPDKLETLIGESGSIGAFFGNGAVNMTSPRSVVFANPARTAIGTFRGSLKEIAAPNLGAAAIKAAIERAGLKPDEVGTVAMGNVIQAGTKMNPARQAAIHGGLPVSVPAMTVNRVCGSGAQAIGSPAHEILFGSVDAPVAGGMENIDLAPSLTARAPGWAGVPAGPGRSPPARRPA